MINEFEPIVPGGLFMGATKTILTNSMLYNLYPWLGKDLGGLHNIFEQGIFFSISIPSYLKLKNLHK